MRIMIRFYLHLLCLIGSIYLLKAQPLPCRNIGFSVTPACVGNPFRFEAQTGANTYKWFFDDGTPEQTTTSTVINHTFNSKGTYQVRLIRVGNGCTDTLVKNVNVAEVPIQPDFSFFPNNIPCSGSEITFSANNADPTMDYYWVFEDGDTLEGMSVSKKLRVFGNGNIASKVRLIVSDHGCITFIEKNVAVKAEPQFTFETSADECLLCNERDLTLTISTSASELIDSVIVDWGDNQKLKPNNYNSIFTHRYQKLGDYNFSILVYGKNGCIGKHGCTLKIDTDLNPIEEFSIVGGNDAGCNPFEAEIQDQTTQIGPTTVLTLDFGDGTPSQIFVGKGFGRIKHKFINKNNCVAQYPISLSGVSQCYQIVERKVKYFTVFMPPVLRLSLNPINNQLCIDDTLRVTNMTLPILGICNGDTSRGVRTDYRWNWGDSDRFETASVTNSKLPQQNLKHKYDKIGTYDFYLEACERRYTPDVLGSCRCKDTIIKITVNPNPNADILIPNKLVVIRSDTDSSTTLTDQSLFVRNRKWVVTPSVGWEIKSPGSDTSKSVSIKFTREGNYVIKLIVENNCSTDQAIDTIKVICPPKLICPNISDGCPPRNFDPTTVLSSNGNSTINYYSWSVYKNDTLLDDCSSQNALPPCTTFTEPGIYKLIIRIGNDAGISECLDSFVVKPLLSLVSLQKDTIILSAGKTDSLITLMNTSKNAENYVWSINPSLGWSFVNGTNANSFEPVVRFFIAGNYTVRLTASNSCNQITTVDNNTGKDNGVVVVIIPPIVTLGPTNDGCSPVKLNLNNFQINNGNGTTAYLWEVLRDNIPVDSCRSQSQTPKCTDFPIPGKYIVKFSCKNVAGEAVWADTFQVFPIPPKPLAINDTICPGKSGTLSCTSEPRDTTEWFDNPNATTPLFIGQPFITPPLSNSKDYYCRNVKNGCPGPLTLVKCVVAEPPVCNIDPNLKVTCGKTVRLGMLMPNDTSELKFTWLPTEGLSCPTCLRTYCKTNTTTTYTLTVVNRFGCTSSCIQPVTVIPLPEVDVLCDPPNCEVCYCDKVILNAVSNQGIKVRWYDQPNGGNLLHIGNSFVTPILCDNKTYYAEAEDTVNRCISIGRNAKSIIVNPKPRCYAWTNPQSFDTTVFCGTTIRLGSNQSPDSLEYLWTPATGLDNNNIPRPTCRLGQTTTYTLTVKNPKTGCISQCNFKVNVKQSDYADISRSDSSICEGQLVRLAAIPNDTSQYSYLWTGNVTIDEPNSPVIYISSNRSFNCKLQVRDKNLGCFSEKSTQIKVNLRPIIQMNDSLFICPQTGKCKNIIPTIIKGTPPYTYKWFPSTFISDPNILNPEFCPPQTITYTLNVYDYNGCDTFSSLVVVPTNPKADFQLMYESILVDGSASKLVVLHASDRIDPKTWNTCEQLYAQIPASVRFINNSINTNKYLWDFGDGNTSTETNPTHLYTKEGEYCIKLVASDDRGCNDVITFCKLKVGNICNNILECVEVPNAFSPNGDAINPEFFIPYFRYYPSSKDCLEEYKLDIYDRWGHLIFTTNDPGKGWDGREFNGNSLIRNETLIYENVFVWKLSLKTKLGNILTKVGNVTVVK